MSDVAHAILLAPFMIILAAGVLGGLFSVASDMYGEREALQLTGLLAGGAVLTGWWSLITADNVVLQVLGWGIAVALVLGALWLWNVLRTARNEAAR